MPGPDAESRTAGNLSAEVRLAPGVDVTILLAQEDGHEEQIHFLFACRAEQGGQCPLPDDEKCVNLMTRVLFGILFETGNHRSFQGKDLYHLKPPNRPFSPPRPHARPRSTVRALRAQKASFVWLMLFTPLCLDRSPRHVTSELRKVRGVSATHFAGGPVVHAPGV